MSPTSPDLTERQRQILQEIASHPHLSYGQHARRLGIAETTFVNHLRRIYRRLCVRGLTAALVLAVQRGWVQLPARALPREDPDLRRFLTTPRRQQVLHSLVAAPNLGCAQRARQLRMAAHTYTNTLRAIYERLDVNNANAALILAAAYGIVDVHAAAPPAAPAAPGGGWRAGG